MRNVAAVSIVLFALLGAVTVSPAGAQPGRLSRAVPAADSTRDRAAAASKLALAQQILQAREEAQQRGPFGQSFRQYWLDRLVPLSAAELLEISAAGPTANLGEEIAASTQAVLADNGIQSLGDTSADLVYTKIAPCRVVDTRVTGGALGTASSRDFYVAGTTGFAGQGGAPCGIPVGATSVAVNVTVVSATGYGWLRAYPYGGSGNASVINFKAGDTIANGLILPICDPAVSTCAKDLTVVADSYGGHVLLDVMGYFQYVNKANYRSTVVTSRTNIQVDAPHMQCVNYLSVSVVAPGPGQIVAQGRLDVELTHTTGYVNELDWGIATSPTGCDSLEFGLGGSWVYRAEGSPSAKYHEWDAVTHTVSVTAAGTYTYYLVGKAYLDHGTARMYYGGLAATFHPQ